MADDKMRGVVAECPHCEKGIVVPQERGTAQQGSPVKLHPVRRESPQEAQSTQQKSQPSAQESTRVTEFDRMAEREADRRRKEQVHATLMLCIKMATVVVVATVGFSMWKGYKTGNLTEQKEALARKLQSASEELEMQRQRMADMERRADQAERKVDEMKGRESEFAHVNERKLQEADRTIKELRANLEASSAAHEQKIAELKAKHQRELETAARAAEERVENMRVAMSARSNPSSDQGNSIDKQISHDGSSGEYVEELRRKLDENLAEIKKLRTENPTCYINPKDPACPNISQRIAMAKDARYSTNNKVTYVRDAFSCSRCRRTTAYQGSEVTDYDDGYRYCAVCRQQSFYMWLKYRKNVEKTAKIDKRIDEIYRENTLLEKKISKAR